MRVVKDIQALLHYREVVTNLVSADLKLRYRRSVLGYAWSLIYPLMTIGIMTLVFSQAMGFDSRSNYVLYVFAGLLPWNFLVNGFWGAGAAIINNESVLRKIYLPKLIFPVSVTLARFLDFLFNLVALFLIVSLISFRPSWSLLALPLAVIILFVFTSGITIGLSAVNVYIRDTTHLVSVLMQFGFYLTPIIYDVNRMEKMPEKYKLVFELNPMTHIIRLFQEIIAHGQMPSGEKWALAAAIATAAMVIGYGIFAKLERNLIFRL
jgi:ABC-type polysaccharide/polyol phosphate export permease